LTITCIDTILKNHLATIILDKYGNKIDEWYQQNITVPLLSIPECPVGKLIGYGVVKKRKRKRKSSKRKPKGIGIVALCKEAKEFLEKYDPKVNELAECDLIEFAFAEGEKKLTPYQEFIKKCSAELKDEVKSAKERLVICAQRWKEEKWKKKR